MNNLINMLNVVTIAHVCFSALTLDTWRVPQKVFIHSAFQSDNTTASSEPCNQQFRKKMHFLAHQIGIFTIFTNVR